MEQRIGMASLAGTLLVAAKSLVDPNFARSVVLIVHHNEQGAFGLVLNRATGSSLATVWEDLVAVPCPVDLPLMSGGPVDGLLLALHAHPDHGDHEVVPGVRFVGRHEALVSLVNDAVQPLRVFTGYSGWAAGQLEAEIESGSWGLFAASRELVFSDESTLWQRVTARIADAALVDWLGIRHVPERPWHN